MSGKIRLEHPGEHLREILAELGISQYRFAHATRMPASAVCALCAGKRRITAETAMRIARALRMSPQFWLNYQARWDFERAEDSAATAELEKIEPLVPACA